MWQDTEGIEQIYCKKALRFCVLSELKKVANIKK